MKHGCGLEHEEMPKELCLFSFKRRLTGEIVVVFSCHAGGQRGKKDRGEGVVGGEAPHTLIATAGTQIKDHNFHQGSKCWNRCPGRLCKLHPWNCSDTDCTGPAQSGRVGQGVGLDDSRGPFQPKPFCNSATVLFLTLLRLRLCFNIGSKALTKARCIISAVTSAVNPCIIHQLSTLPLATLNPALCESPPPAGG